MGLAQALVHDPEILILDEPMTGLDPNQLEEIRHLIKETGKKKTVLLSTHIMQEVEAICDRVIIINQGKIVADRPIGEICTHADEGMVLRVEFSPGSDTHWLSKSELFTHTSQQAPNCWRLTSPQVKDPREALFFEAAVRRCPIIALHTEVYQLEDIFHRYTVQIGKSSVPVDETTFRIEITNHNPRLANLKGDTDPERSDTNPW